MVKKITIFIMIFGLVFGSIPLFTKNVKAQENDIINLASPNLQDKDYLGDGVYRIRAAAGLTIDYNVYSGNFILNGTPTGNAVTSLDIFNIPIDIYSFSFYKVSGTSNLTTLFYNIENINNRIVNNIRNNDIIYNENVLTTSNIISLIFSDDTRTTYDNYQFKLQIEKGTSATAYQVPIEALKQHIQLEKDKSYNDGFESKNVFFGNYYYEQGSTSDSYWLRPRVKHYTIHDLNNNKVKMFDGRPYWVGSLSELAQNKTTYYRDDIPVFTLSNSGYFVFSENDILYFYIGVEPISINPSSFMTFDGNNIVFMYNGNIEYEYSSLSTMTQLNYIKDYSLDPDYYEGYDVGKQEGIDIGIDIGYFDGFQEGQDLGYGLGFDDGKLISYDNGYTDGYDNGYSTGLNETDATGFGALLTTVFSGLGGLLAIELLPNIHIGAIIAVPLVFGIIFFILGKRKGD